MGCKIISTTVLYETEYNLSFLYKPNFQLEKVYCNIQKSIL